MAGKKLVAPTQVYVILSALYHESEITVHGVYVDRDAAAMASNNNMDLVHVVPVNYNSVYVSLVWCNL